MNEAPAIPPMFQMAVPFENMNGKKIRVTTKDASAPGDLQLFRKPQEGKIGIRVDYSYQVDRGTAQGVSLLLTQSEIERIRRSDEDGVPFILDLR